MNIKFVALALVGTATTHVVSADKPNPIGPTIQATATLPGLRRPLNIPVDAFLCDQQVPTTKLLVAPVNTLTFTTDDGGLGWYQAISNALEDITLSFTFTYPPTVRGGPGITTTVTCTGLTASGPPPPFGWPFAGFGGGNSFTFGVGSVVFSQPKDAGGRVLGAADMDLRVQGNGYTGSTTGSWLPVDYPDVNVFTHLSIADSNNVGTLVAERPWGGDTSLPNMLIHELLDLSSGSGGTMPFQVLVSPANSPDYGNLPPATPWETEPSAELTRVTISATNGVSANEKAYFTYSFAPSYAGNY
jgi:hypothetical protein